MKKLLLIILLLMLPNLAFAQSQRNPCYNPNATQGQYENCVSVGVVTPLPVVLTPPGAGITGNATGTTGAVVGTLAAAAGKTTYICGFDITAVGGTATVGPIVVAGLIGGSATYYLTSSVAGSLLSKTYTPCIPASAVNTAITTTTTADGTASNVTVNSWGYQQ